MACTLEVRWPAAGSSDAMNPSGAIARKNRVPTALRICEQRERRIGDRGGSSIKNTNIAQEQARPGYSVCAIYFEVYTFVYCSDKDMLLPAPNVTQAVREPHSL